MIYCFMCEACNQSFEVSRRIKDAALPADCPQCGIPSNSRDFLAEGAEPATAAINASNQYPYVSSRLPKGLDDAPTDKFGKTVVVSRSHEQHIMDKYGYKRD